MWKNKNKTIYVNSIQRNYAQKCFTQKCFIASSKFNTHIPNLLSEKRKIPMVQSGADAVKHFGGVFKNILGGFKKIKIITTTIFFR